MLNAIIKSLLGGWPPAAGPVAAAAAGPVLIAAPVPPPAPDPMPVDAPATIPDFSDGARAAPASRFEPPSLPGAPPASAQAPAPAAHPGPAATLASPAPALSSPAPAVQSGIPAASEAPVWQSVPLSFRPDPSIRHDEDAARAQAIETQRRLWVAEVGRTGAPSARPGTSAGEAPGDRPEGHRTEAA